jgi:hypothetical protein
MGNVHAAHLWGWSAPIGHPHPIDSQIDVPYIKNVRLKYIMPNMGTQTP